MFRLRPALPVLTAGLILAATAGAAHGQAARIEDIQVLVEDGRFQALVRTSGQPTAASVDLAASRLVVEVLGLDLAAFETRAAPGAAVSRVTASTSGPGVSRLELSGVALESVETVIFRHALLIDGRLAVPELEGSESLLTKDPRTAAHPKPPEPVAPVSTPVSMVAAAPPVTHTPSALKPPVPAGDGARETCAGYASRLAEDAWDMGALGPAALCLIDSGDTASAAPLLDRLSAFSPDNWRAEFGRGRLAEIAGDPSRAEIAFRNALQLADNDPDRQLIRARLLALTSAR